MRQWEEGTLVTQSTDARTRGPNQETRRRSRAELGQFLKARRARFTPEDFGMPAGSRRRTPGLRREEVALLAGVGVTWYTWLEQGRPINVSAQVLDAVASTLRMDTAEREHLYRLAEATPVRAGAGTTAASEALTEVIQSLEPLPALLMNNRFDVLEANAAHTAVFRDWHTMPCVHRNLLWCAVTEPSAREKFLNYDEEVRYLVARLRARYSSHIGDTEWEEDIRRLACLSQEFRELWERHEVAEPQTRTRVLVHPDQGKLCFTVTEMEFPAMPGILMSVYTPEDSHTRAVLTRLCPPPPAVSPAVTGAFSARPPHER
jgi:hypothetical protein